MDKKLFEHTVDLLLQKAEETEDIFILEEIVEQFKLYIKTNPDDSEMIITYAIFLYEDIHDRDDALKQLDDLLAKDSNNARAILVKAMIMDFSLGEFDEKTFEQMCAVKTNDLEMLSMLEYIKANGYYFDNKEQRKQCLINSVNFYQKHVNNNVELALIYLSEGNIEGACKLLKRALRNIAYLYPHVNPYIGTIYSITPVDEYIDYFIKGTYTMDDKMKELGQLYLTYSKINNDKKTTQY